MLAKSVETHAGLTCRIVDVDDRPAQPELLVVICHGYGAPGTDLVPVGGEILQKTPTLQGRVRFVFPEAPLSMAAQGLPSGRAWWPLDIIRLQRAFAENETDALRIEQPPELDDRCNEMTRLITELCTQHELDTDRVVLGGFSQGSMLMTDVALELETAPAGLLVWSGALIFEDRWRERVTNRAGLPVFQSHGRQDAILPFSSGAALHGLFTEAGLAAEFQPFNGGHAIPIDAVDGAIDMLQSLLSQ